MKKIAVLLLSFLFSLCTEIFSQEEIMSVQQSIISSESITVFCYKQNGNTYYDRSTFDQFLGRYNGKRQKDEETFRFIMKFNLSSIPDSAVISDVWFNFTPYVDTLIFNFRIAAFNYNTSGAQNEWNATQNSTVYRSSVNTISSDFHFRYSNNDDTLFLNAMENALASN